MLVLAFWFAITIPPVDEGSRDPSFAKFRAELSAAFDRRDRPFVESALAQDANLSFGGHTGVRAFREMYPPGKEPWAKWRRMISLGGRWRRGGFEGPYVFTDFPRELDEFSFGVSIDERVSVRLTPSPLADVVDFLNWETFEYLDNLRGEWTLVRTPRNREGYVRSESVWSPIDFRIRFEKRNGVWKIAFWLQGD
ncbi:MAG: SH3 domain-containing protein [Bryobacteraceae bacterium]|nr:SH3 domain-containing protein [Bryobacteraceae bacterium]